MKHLLKRLFLNRHFLFANGLLMSVTLSVAGIAQDKSPVRFANKAQKQVIIYDDKGDKQRVLTDAKVMVPGDTVVYTSTFTNIGPVPVSNIVVSNPIPANTQYIIFSAKGKGTTVTFSVDGGKTYAPASELKVFGENGQKQTAQSKHYTDIRWVYRGELSSGTSGSVSFNVNIL